MLSIAADNDFRSRLIAHAKVAVDRAGRAATEAATNQYLVMPFVQLLGYDPLDPDEIIPEAHASFSEKFRNRVDFAICQNHIPVIAMESKRVGSLAEGHRGELKGYFNAVPTVKLGILTDGLTFQMFTDTNAVNMMDDEPFAVIDLTQVAQELVDPHALDALSRLRKGTFDPANVGSDARRKMNVTAYALAIEKNLQAPEERFIRVMMDITGVEGRRTPRLVDEHGVLLREAAEAVLDRKILERVGFAERSDLVRMRAETPPATPVVIETGPEETAPPSEAAVVTTAMEQEVFDYVRTRLPFLIDRSEETFRALSHVKCVDHKTVFCVYYKQERKGKLFDFRETAGSPRLRFAFAAPEASATIATDSIGEVDKALLAAFNARISELGT